LLNPQARDATVKLRQKGKNGGIIRVRDKNKLKIIRYTVI